MAMLVGWLMTGGSARTAALRRVAMRTLTRLPGVERKLLDVTWPAFRAGPLTARRDRTAGRPCPHPRIRTARGDVPLDDEIGDGFAIIGREHTAVDPDTRDFFDAIGTRIITLPDVDRTLLVRPDRVIAASAGRVDLRAWRRLLEAAGIHAA
jgi:3-(3-hydroxy-phenyl)propionate hydroxylase